MREINVVPCADGYTRADTGCLRMPVSKTADFSISQGDAGAVFNNTGASGAVVATLPALPKDGSIYHFFVTAAQTLTVKAGGSESINNNSSGTIANAGTNAVANLTLIAIGANWFARTVGTWVGSLSASVTGVQGSAAVGTVTVSIT